MKRDFFPVVIICFLLACGSGSVEIQRQFEVAKTGTISLQLTDFPLAGNEVSKVLVSITRIEAHSAASGWFTGINYDPPRIFDLLELQNGNTAELGGFNLEVGQYTQIRIHVSEDNQIEVDEGSGPMLKPLQVPSGPQTGIKLVNSFTVTEDGLTVMLLDFDASKSVVKAGSKYLLKPIIRVISVVTCVFSPKFTTEWR